MEWATEFLESDLFASDHLDHARGSDSHRGHSLDHDGEIREDGRVGGAGDTRAVQDADLRDAPREHRVVVVVLAYPFAVGEKARLLIDTSAGGIHQVEDGLARFSAPAVAFGGTSRHPLRPC